MRTWTFTLAAIAYLSGPGALLAQDSSPMPSIPKATTVEPPTTSTVILALDHVSEKSRGKVYVYGSVKGQGPQEIPADESYTVSKAIIRAGGFGDFANKRKVRVTRKDGKNFVVDLKRVIEEGHTD